MPHGILVLVLMLLVLLVWTHRDKWKEGFDSPLPPSSLSKYNPLTNTINLTSPTVSLTPAHSAQFQQATASLVAQPTSGTYVLSSHAPYPLPTAPPATLLQAQRCEAAHDCSAFDDPTFAAQCGMSFDTNGVTSTGALGPGGRYISPEDRATQLALATEIEQTGRAPYDPYQVYQPTIGQSAPGTFALTKEQCQVVKEKVDCATKQTFGTPNCTQCYSSSTFSRVGPEAQSLPFVLHFFGKGTLTVSGSMISLAATPLNAANPTDVTVPAHSEGTTFTVHVSGSSCFLQGYLEGTTTSGPFRLDANTLIDKDTVTGSKPRMAGTHLCGDFRCITLIPGTGQSSMNLSCMVPFTFISNYDGDALGCPNAPLITKEASATFLESDPCYGKANQPGNYSLSCLQTRWMELGGTTDGTGYPKDAATAAALQHGPDGSPYGIDTIMDLLSAKAAQAATGTDGKGTPLSIPDWNAVSMMMTGVPIQTPCDGPANAQGPVSQECLSYLYTNQGSTSHIGSTYTLPDTVASALKTPVHEGFYDATATYNYPGTTLDPTTTTGLSTGQTLGGVEAVKKAYDAVHRLANDNTKTNVERSAALQQAYGIQLGPPAAAASHDFDVRVPAQQPTQSYQDLAAHCSQMGMRLCFSNEICDMTQRTVINPELTSSFPDDNWIAVGDSTNEWLTLNHGDNRYCKTHTEVAGQRPAWGTSEAPAGWERLAKCCPLPAAGQYAQYIHLQYNHTECLNLAQIQVYTSDDPASQVITPRTQVTKSSGYQGDIFPVSNFVDGVGKSFVHSSCGDVPWIRVNLGSPTLIYKIVVTNRHDCCQERILGTVLQLLDSSQQPLYQSDAIFSVHATYTWFPPNPAVYPDWSAGEGFQNAEGFDNEKPDPAFHHIGCWADTAARAMPILEGTDPLITGPYQNRPDAIHACYQAARTQGMKIFGVQDGGHCQGDTNFNGYAKYGASNRCSGGKGGPWANDVYVIGDEPVPPPPPPKSTPWKCIPGIAVPLRKNDGGDVECASGNQRDCYWQPNDNNCNILLSIGNRLHQPWTIGNQSLVCGAMHQRVWGGPGYDNPQHWCARGKAVLDQ